MNRNLVGSIYGNCLFRFRPVLKNGWSISKYMAGEMGQSLLESSYEKPSIKIRKQTFPPQVILASGWYIYKTISHGTTWLNKNIIL